MLGDNLGSHQIGGFTENFSTSKYLCRYCLFTRESLKAFEPQVAEERTPKHYFQYATDDLSNGMGVMRNSCLNQLKYYQVCDGLPPCLSHDFFKGIIPYDSMEVLRYLSKFNVITADVLNISLSSLRKKIKLFHA